MSIDNHHCEKVHVSLDVVWHGTSGKHDARMSELAASGCFIDSYGQEVLGETVSFKVHLPSGLWLPLKGEVIYREYPVGFELRFDELSNETKRAILEVVAAHGGKEARAILETLTAAEPQPANGTPICMSAVRKRLLVADDDPMTLMVLKAIGETVGYEVVSARDGQEAYQILQTDSDFHSAIFDMLMPRLNGLDLITYMKSNAQLSRIPVGLITAQQDPKIWDDTKAAGACAFLPKPFTPPQIQMLLSMLSNEGRAV